MAARSREQADVRRSAALLVAVLAYCGCLVSVTQTLALPLLPELPEVLGSTPNNVAWIASATLLAGAIANPVLGRLGDMYGKRSMMLVSMGSLIVGSAIAALSSSLLPLVVGRALQGIAIAAIPLGISVARDALPSDRVGGAVALVSASLGIGGGLAIPLAGFVLEGFGWRAVFWLSCALGVLGLIAVVLAVPASPGHARGGFDITGALWLSAVLVALLLPISKAPDWGLARPLPLALLGSAVAFGVGWVRFERRQRQPLVDIVVMRRPAVLFTNLAGFLLGFAMFSNFFISIALLQLPADVEHGFDLTIVGAGVVLLPGALVQVAMAPVTARLIRVFGARATLLSGAVAVAAGFAVRPVLLGSALAVGLGFALVNCGVSLAYGSLPAVIMANVPQSETASANAISTLARAAGAAVATAVAAGVMGLLTVTVGDAEYASLPAFQVMFALATIAAVVAAGFAARLPKTA